MSFEASHGSIYAKAARNKNSAIVDLLLEKGSNIEASIAAAKHHCTGPLGMQRWQLLLPVVCFEDVAHRTDLLHAFKHRPNGYM